ncbi:2-dehydropantoate 2-reductase [Pseudonocardia benzenivorans]|uniref:2-dehydropantoate 2-reductase n=2 Tax=Pseudonocardia TaxID=1847 RepID=F4CQ61_PSEUX|nr:2-dehydropantoate 2-reductase [Pseudonocardia dioxanivorans]AEA28334.1 2-dehydropantoate 2-reductase [Pseudonocardia dioxanivorans CB1190]GJF05905.1 2-dehydropantoate 2-reductase [Pseudonocardia sp. D17]
MRILVLGAGAIGGYFGGRLAAAGRDVTFLVRPARAALLAQNGLHVRSPHGDFAVAAPTTVTADAVRDPYDLVILGAKGYDLDSAVDAIAPAVGPDTAVLPLLNGMRHIDVLDDRFGPEAVLGGTCLAPLVLRADGSIDHLGEPHTLTHGELKGGTSARSSAIQEELTGAGFDAVESADILQDMWEKWVFLASAAGITSLMRAPVGDIVAAGGTALVEQLIAEVAGIAEEQGRPPRAAALAQTRAGLTAPGSPMTASMMRDIDAGHRTEVDHIIGDLLARAGDRPVDLLRTVFVHVKTYEARREREAG